MQTVGFDISDSACRDYQIRTGKPAHRVDLTKSIEVDEFFDAALVIGGLHHCVIDLDTTLKNVARMLRPGGSFMMMEPSDDFFLSAVRRYWYQRDGWFEASTERALKHEEIAAIGAPYFEPEFVTYLGGPAFYLILNSLITRVPLSMKPALSTVLFPLESLYNKLPGRSPFAIFIARWRRTSVEI